MVILHHSRLGSVYYIAIDNPNTNLCHIYIYFIAEHDCVGQKCHSRPH